MIALSPVAAQPRPTPSESHHNQPIDKCIQIHKNIYNSCNPCNPSIPFPVTPDLSLFADPRFGVGLSLDEVTALAEQGGELAVRRMIPTKHQGLVIDIAKRFRNRGLDMDDLNQEGNIGLIKACYKYDFSFYVRFSVHATWWIKQAIRYAVLDAPRPLRIPRETHRKANNVQVGRARLADFPEEERATIAHAISVLGMSANEDSAWMRVAGRTCLAGRTVTIDRRPNEYRKLNGILEKLTTKHRYVVMARYGMCPPSGRDTRNGTLTLEEVGKSLGVTKERTRQIENEAIKLLWREARKRELTFEECLDD